MAAGNGAYREYDPITNWSNLPSEKVYPLTEEVAVEDEEYDYDGASTQNVRKFENKFNRI